MDEAYCRSVIDYVAVEAPADQNKVLVGELEAELNDRLQDDPSLLAEAPADATGTCDDDPQASSPSAP